MEPKQIWTKRARLSAFANIASHVFFAMALARIMAIMMDPLQAAHMGNFQFSYDLRLHTAFLILAFISLFGAKKLSVKPLIALFVANGLITCWVLWQCIYLFRV